MECSVYPLRSPGCWSLPTVVVARRRSSFTAEGRRRISQRVTRHTLRESSAPLCTPRVLGTALRHRQNAASALLFQIQNREREVLLTVRLAVPPPRSKVRGAEGEHVCSNLLRIGKASSSEVAEGNASAPRMNSFGPKSHTAMGPQMWPLMAEEQSPTHQAAVTQLGAQGSRASQPTCVAPQTSEDLKPV